MTKAQIARVGMIAADKARRKYSVSEETWVDVFATVAKADALLMFRPLGKLGGAYLADADMARGIIINSNHPLSRQRLSAAHELAHLEFKHDSTLDVIDLFSEDVRSQANSEAEKLAESFAGWFLMPHRLIDASIKAMQVEKIETSDDVYRLALHMGTSYEATAVHLVAAQRATVGRSIAWRKEAPAVIKRRIAGLYVPPDIKNDVHDVRYRETGTARLVRSGDRILLRLPERPTTGYRWHLATSLSERFEIVSDGYTSSDPPVCSTDAEDTYPSGGERERLFVLAVRECDAAFDAVIIAENARAWRQNEALQKFALTVSIQPRVRLGMPERYFTEAA